MWVVMMVQKMMSVRTGIQHGHFFEKKSLGNIMFYNFILNNM